MAFFFSQAQLYPGNQSVLTQMKERQVGVPGVRDQEPLSVVFPMRKGDELMPKRGLENAGYYS